MRFLIVFLTAFCLIFNTASASTTSIAVSSATYCKFHHIHDKMLCKTAETGSAATNDATAQNIAQGNTGELAWWSALSKEWKSVFKEQFHLRGIVTEDDVQKVWTARSLNLTGRADIYDLNPLTALNNLEELNCNDTPISDISALSKVLNIKVLRLRSTEVKDFRVLAKLTQLERLDVSFTAFNALELLANLKSLHLLSIRQTPILDLDGIEKCTILDTLIAGSCQYDDIKPLSKLINLRYLDICNTRVLSLEALTPLKLLSGLRASKLSIHSIHVVEKLYNLAELDVSSTLIDDELFPLTKLVSLKRLDITDTPVHSLKNIRHLADLQELSLTTTYISPKDVDMFEERVPLCKVNR